MRKLLALTGALLLGAAVWPVAFWLAPLLPDPPSLAFADPLPWRYSDGKATLAFSIEEHLPDYDVELVKKMEYYTPIKIRSKLDCKVVYVINEGHPSLVFTRWQDVLYIAEFCPICTGCSVVAVDLKTSNTLWKTDLQGIGPTGHSKYHNQINLETDGKKIIVYGNESHGKYVEILDIDTGRTLRNHRFDLD